MMKFLNDVLMDFRGCFSRKAAFQWFVVIVAGLLVRTDHLGVTSIIRGLLLAPDYMGLIGFFRSSAWTLEKLTAKWCALVMQYAPLVKQGDAVILVGDGVKQAKEGRRMPGVKRQHQESEDSSKPEYMWGHLFGGVGILAGAAGKLFCLPLALRIQDGVKAIFGWDKQPKRQESHVCEMIRLAYETAVHFGKAILLLDRLFLTVPALLILDTLNASGQTLQIVTKAKRNCIAYHPPEAKTGRRGRPRKKGAAVKVFELFGSENFLSAEITLYGKLEQVRYHCTDLLWGQGLYKKLRFVLVEYNNIKTVLVSSDLSLEPLGIIKLYSRRFGVETMFREMKQVICAFGYRFWSKYMPKLNRFRKKTDLESLEQVTDKHAQKRIRLAVKAIEGFMCCSVIATGLLQMVSLRFSGSDEVQNLRYMRTYRNSFISEATAADFLRKNFFCFLHLQPNLGINQIISAKQDASLDSSRFHEVA